MRIEISAGGIGGISVVDFQSDMQAYISNAESVISSFKAIQSSTCNLNGGVGSLQGALDEIDQRVASEAAVQNQARHIQSKAAGFIQLAERIDKQVAVDVNQNKDELYRVNPWLRPNASVEDTRWYEDAWNWLCDKGEQIADGLKKAWDWAKDTAKKAWDGLVEFYNENKKIIDTVLILVGAIVAVAAVVFTGGASLIYLLTVLGCSYGAAAGISAAVGVLAIVTTIGASTLNVVDIWAEVDNPTFEKWKLGLNIASGVFNFVYSIGNTFNSLKGVSTTESIARARAIDNGRKGYGNLTGLNNRIQIEPNREFSQAQKHMIREENIARNGELRCDLTGERCGVYQPSSGSQKLGNNYIEIDHIYPKHLGGANSFDNAQAINWQLNNAKRASLTYDVLKAARNHSLFTWNVDLSNLVISQLPNYSTLFNVSR